MKDLSSVKTCDLVEELKSRDGVEAYTAEPYEGIRASVEGPAVVLVITD